MAAHSVIDSKVLAIVDAVGLLYAYPDGHNPTGEQPVEIQRMLYEHMIQEG